MDKFSLFYNIGVAPGNGGSPISRLPVELTGSIFMFCVGNYSRDPGLCRSWLWLARLIYVCRYWASVAKQTPLLWTHIPLRLPCAAVNVMLALKFSGQLPLDVGFTH